MDLLKLKYFYIVAKHQHVMLVCFGLSWPISVYKSATSRSTKGKSPLFMSAILIGYVAGILGKLVGGNVNYVLAVYAFNFLVVSVDFALYFINKKRENETERKEETERRKISFKVAV